ncbi:GATA zinc finger domain-containing protein 10-like, partial [Anastrepha ludens]|uniref:GATA zinc finger domain-containing protein 10-like n=1 Tax=Anastrepha ludens TaxID=28586 RepID=UPI0023B104F5
FVFEGINSIPGNCVKASSDGRLTPTNLTRFQLTSIIDFFKTYIDTRFYTGHKLDFKQHSCAGGPVSGGGGVVGNTNSNSLQVHHIHQPHLPASNPSAHIPPHHSILHTHHAGTAAISHASAQSHIAAGLPHSGLPPVGQQQQQQQSASAASAAQQQTAHQQQQQATQSQTQQLHTPTSGGCATSNGSTTSGSGSSAIGSNSASSLWLHPFQRLHLCLISCHRAWD